MTTKKTRPKLTPLRLSPAERVRVAYTLTPLDLRVCEIYFENPAVSFKEAAALCGTTAYTVKASLAKPAVIKRLADMRESISELIKRGQVLAVRKLMQLCMSKDEYIALSAAKYFLKPILDSYGAAGGMPADDGRKIVFEVQVGPQGQVFQTMQVTAGNVVSPNPQGFPTVMDMVHEGNLAEGLE